MGFISIAAVTTPIAVAIRPSPLIIAGNCVSIIRQPSAASDKNSMSGARALVSVLRMIVPIVLTWDPRLFRSFRTDWSITWWAAMPRRSISEALFLKSGSSMVLSFAIASI